MTKKDPHPAAVALLRRTTLPTLFMANSDKSEFAWGGQKRIHTGKLSCFLAGISTFFPRSIASARALRLRVECGMITSSI